MAIRGSANQPIDSERVLQWVQARVLAGDGLGRLISDSTEPTLYDRFRQVSIVPKLFGTPTEGEAFIDLMRSQSRQGPAADLPDALLLDQSARERLARGLTTALARSDRTKHWLGAVAYVCRHDLDHQAATQAVADAPGYREDRYSPPYATGAEIDELERLIAVRDSFSHGSRMAQMLPVHMQALAFEQAWGLVEILNPSPWNSQPEVREMFESPNWKFHGNVAVEIPGVHPIAESIVRGMGATRLTVLALQEPNIVIERAGSPFEVTTDSCLLPLKTGHEDGKTIMLR